MRLTEAIAAESWARPLRRLEPPSATAASGRSSGLASTLTLSLVAVTVGLMVAGAMLLAGVRLREVTSGSMVPTYPVHSWLVTAERGGVRGADVERGEVVVFRYPFGSDLRAIKRVVAVPGDTVELHSTQVVVNGTALPVTPADPKASEPAGDQDVVPAGAVFLLGDNSPASIDSRSFGLVAEDELTGRVLMRLPASPLVLLGAAAALVAAGAGAVRLRDRRRRVTG